jgi:hypothetical protein
MRLTNERQGRRDVRVVISHGLAVVLLTLAICGNAQSESRRRDSYDVLLHSRSFEQQRAALTAILRNPMP